MKKFLVVFICCLFIYLPSRQQTANDTIQRQTTGDTIQKKDSVKNKVPLYKPGVRDSLLSIPVKIDSAAILLADSLAKLRIATEKRQLIEQFQQVTRQHPYFPFDEKPSESNIFKRKETENESLFYFLTGLLLYFACIRLIFGKYLSNLTTLFFRATMRQQQIRDQLLQAPLPSLLLNILFVISGALYLSLLMKYYGFSLSGNFWITLLYATGFVSAVYLGKYIVLKLTGWIFNIRSATDTYIFIVFLVNKMIGIFLLPFVILMSFSNQYLLPVIIPVSYLMLILFLCYRFMNSFRPIRSEIKVSRFQFFLYLCAFEIAPLLLIYKVLLAFVERSN